MPDQLFQTLFAEADHLVWASTDEVRRRGRRRRSLAALGVAVALTLVVIAGGIVAARTGSQSRPAPATTPSLSVPEIHRVLTEALFLQPDDGGLDHLSSEIRELDDNWTAVDILVLVGCFENDVVPDRNILQVQERNLDDWSRQVRQYVARFAPGEAARYLDELRASIRSCAPGQGQSVRLVAQRFAGQDALLIDATIDNGDRRAVVLVRQGDLLTEFTPPSSGTGGRIELAKAAARRLCEGTPVC